MRRTGLLWVAVAAIAIIISGCSKTEGTKPPSSEQPAGRSGAVGTGGAGANLSDDDFVRDVALKNMAEVELSRMALDKATNPDIKSFAQRMIDDHGAAGHKLKSVLSGQPIEWPAAARRQAQEDRRRAGEETGRRFRSRLCEGNGRGPPGPRREARVPTRRAVARRLENGRGRPHRHEGPARTQNRNARRASPSQQERQRGHDEDQPVGGRHVPRRAKAPRYRQNARDRDEETFDQLKAVDGSHMGQLIDERRRRRQVHESCSVLGLGDFGRQNSSRFIRIHFTKLAAPRSHL